MEAELNDIVQLVQQLDDFKPVTTPKKARGRPKSSLNQKSSNTLPTLFDKFCSFSKKIITRLDILERENATIKAPIMNQPKLDILNLDPKSNKAGTNSYASAVTGINLPPVELVQKIDDRVDRIEQDSLSDTLKLDGPIIKQIIVNHNSNPNKDRENLKEIITTEINKVKPLKISNPDISDSFIVGRDSKHIKLVFKSAAKKQEVLKALKTEKPNDLFGSDYLTKERSNLLYKLRKIRSSNPSVKSVYIYGGNICCKLVNSPNIFYLNTSAAYHNFIKENKLNE